MLFATADVAITGRAGYDLWLLGGFSLFMAAALGFVAGYLSARMRDRASHHKARSCLIRLFESISRILTRHRPSVPADHASEAQVSTKSSDLRSTILTKLQWKVDQVHPVSGLPDLETFKANLDMLVERGAQTQRASGLLVVQIDRLSNLRTRFGTAGADTLLRKMAFISCRSVRDEDLVCQTSVDQIAVLIPEVDAEAGAKLARTVRDAIRQHHFRIEEQGMEILVTASLGYAACQPEDHADTLMDRAIDALRLSQRLGRNQLHVHNGDAVLHCAAAV